MALIDFLQSAEKITNTPAGADALATTDIVMAQAAKTQENRMRREELQRKIDNLRKQNDELKARRESLKASTSLANLDEDKIVAIAKAKGIKDEDIDMWLRARQQRSAREISEGQRKELGRGATAQEMANKDAAIQAIFEAKRELAEAKAEEKLASAEMKEAKGEAVAAAENKFETLKAQFEKIHGEPWEDIERGAPKAPKAVENAPAVVDESPSIDVKLSPEEIGALQTNEPGLLEKFRSGSGLSYDERLAIKGKAKDYIAAEARKRREEAEEKAKKKSEQEEAEAEAKEKKKDEAMNRRAKIKADANNPNLSRAAKDALVARYRKTFEDTDERTPSRTEAEKELFGD
jgi:hypothetical protein